MYFDEYHSALESQLSTVLGMTMVIGHSVEGSIYQLIKAVRKIRKLFKSITKPVERSAGFII
jgi:hypothetical protein